MRGEVFAFSVVVTVSDTTKTLFNTDIVVNTLTVNVTLVAVINTPAISGSCIVSIAVEDVEVGPVSSIQITYYVETTMSTSVSTLQQSLSSSVQSGAFTALLRQNAATFNAQTLESVSVTDAQVSTTTQGGSLEAHVAFESSIRSPNPTDSITSINNNNNNNNNSLTIPFVLLAVTLSVLALVAARVLCCRPNKTFLSKLEEPLIS